MISEATSPNRRRVRFSPVESVPDGRKLLIGAYRESDPDTERFIFNVGERQDFVQQHTENWVRFPSEPTTLELIRLVPVPPEWHNDMEKLMSTPGAFHDPKIRTAYLGFMEIRMHYHDDRVIAETYDYYPKQCFSDETLFPEHTVTLDLVPGLGYLAEWVALASIRDRITDVISLMYPMPEWDNSWQRTEQLRVVGLPDDQIVPKNRWMSGILYGYLETIRRHRYASELELNILGILYGYADGRPQGSDSISANVEGNWTIVNIVDSVLLLRRLGILSFAHSGTNPDSLSGVLLTENGKKFAEDRISAEDIYVMHGLKTVRRQENQSPSQAVNRLSSALPYA